MWRVNDMNLSTELNISNLLKKLEKDWKYIVLAILTGGLIGFGIARYLITPQYTSRISLYVNNTQSGEYSDSIDISDINASRSLVNTYMTFLKSDYILEQISEEIKEDEYTVEALSSCITCQSIDSTEIFNVFVETEDPQLSARIGNYIAEIAPEEITRVFHTGAVEVIDYAKASEQPSSPDVPFYAVGGAVIGGFISSSVLLMKMLLNQKIKSLEDLEESYSIPVLGILPGKKRYKIRKMR